MSCLPVFNFPRSLVLLIALAPPPSPRARLPPPAPNSKTTSTSVSTGQRADWAYTDVPPPAPVLPLDPAAPRERVDHLVGSVDAKIALCSPDDAASLDGLVDHLLALDDACFDTLPAYTGRPQSQADSYSAAYIIPTSGTTGQPKLSLLEHGNYCTGARAHYAGLGFDTKPLRALQFAAHSFDASVLEILSPLMFGGTICIPDENDRLNNIEKVINHMRVTWACLTPTFVRFLEPSKVPTLATIILMGEAMSQANLDTWSQINLING